MGARSGLPTGCNVWRLICYGECAKVGPSVWRKPEQESYEMDKHWILTCGTLLAVVNLGSNELLGE